MLVKYYNKKISIFLSCTMNIDRSIRASRERRIKMLRSKHCLEEKKKKKIAVHAKINGSANIAMSEYLN